MKKTARISGNKLCPSGQPVKFRECMEAHPGLNERSTAAEVWWVCRRWEADAPPLEDRLAEMSSRPPLPVEKVESILDEALRTKKPEDIEWNDLFRALYGAQYPNLVDVFRRMARAIPHTKKTRVAFFYWAAAEVFSVTQPNLLPEVAQNFRRLNTKSYDADALNHLKEMLLTAGELAEALGLLEHFWPIIRKDRGLMRWVAPETADDIVTLRIGLLSQDPLHALTPTTALVRLINEKLQAVLDPQLLAACIDILWGRVPEPKWVRDDFGVVPPGRRRSEEWWDDDDEGKRKPADKAPKKKPQFAHLDVSPLWLALRYAVADAIRSKTAGAALVLYTVERVHWALSEWQQMSGGGPGNLLDLLASRKLESFIAGTSQDILGPDPNRCLLLIDGLKVCAAFLQSRGLLSADKWKQARIELERLERLARELKKR